MLLPELKITADHDTFSISELLQSLRVENYEWQDITVGENQKASALEIVLHIFKMQKLKKVVEHSVQTEYSEDKPLK